MLSLIKKLSLLASAFAIALTLATPALADGTGTVGFLQVNANGTVRFALQGPLCASAPVGGVGFGDITIGQSGVNAEGLRSMLSLLTVAKMSGKSVRVYAHNGNAGTFGCSVYAIDLQ
jgi:hypothetical protein